MGRATGALGSAPTTTERRTNGEVQEPREGGQPRRIDVPVEIPEGVNRGSANAEFGMATGYLQSLPISGRHYSLMVLNSGTAQTTTKSGTNTQRSKSRTASAGGGVGGGVGGGGGGGAMPGASPPKPASGTAMIMQEAEVVRVNSPEDQLRARVHPSILAVIDRLKKKIVKPGPDETKFIQNGKAEIQIWLTDNSAENLAKLKELGFEVVLEPKSAKLVIGRLSIEKLAALSQLKFVRYVAPQFRNNAPVGPP